MRLLFTAAIVVSAFVSALLAQSQLGTGAISGTIQDSTGAVLPGAKITITQAETGLTRQIQSSDTGQFLNHRGNR